MLMLLSEKTEAEDQGVGSLSVLCEQVSLANTCLECKPMRAETCVMFPGVSQAWYIVDAQEEFI